MAYETIAGRIKEDREKYGNKCVGYIGKHIVGTGEDTHLTTKVFIDLLRPHVILVSGKRGSGKCLEENTLITLDDGRSIPIKELENNKQKVFSLNEKLKIVPTNKSQFYKREINRLLHIKLRSGKEIKLTPEHPLLTISGWHRAENLTIGSRIATPRSIKPLGNKIVDEFKIKLLAYLIAEGHLSNNFILFSNTDSEILEDFIKSVWDFDETLKISRHGKDTWRVTKSKRTVDSACLLKGKNGRIAKGSKVRPIKSSLVLWLEELGLYDKLSREKFIPDDIFRLPEYQLSLFLNRLFSCDGCIYKKKVYDRFCWQISYSSISKKLVKQIQHLLLRFEILSKIRYRIQHINNKTYESYELVLNGENVIKFINIIGFFGKQKNFQETALNECLNLIRNPNVDTIPKEIWNIYRPKNWALIGRIIGYSIPKGFRSSINYGPSRRKLLQMAEIEKNDELLLLATSDIFWDEIVEMTELMGKFTVYDIEVPEFHNFVANDIIVHNSYSAGVILEEFCMLPEEYKKNLAFVVVDPMGIYWSMKYSNEAQSELLRKWNLEPKDLKDCVKIFVPEKQKEEYLKAEIPIDGTITIALKEFTAEDLILSFGLKRTEEISIALEKSFNRLLESQQDFGFDELIDKIKDDVETRKEVKDALVSLLTVADQWGLISKEGINIEELVKPGIVTIIDLSRMRSSELRTLLTALITRKTYFDRVLARKEEERIKIEGGTASMKFPVTWLVLEESHNFIPSDREVASSEPIKRLAKEGREPGIGLVVITQMPAKVHQDILSQTDIVISFRLTSRDDLNALHAVYQTYMAEDLEKIINKLPRQPGAAILLDDNLEKIFTVNIRPRMSWHAGGTAAVI